MMGRKTNEQRAFEAREADYKRALICSWFGENKFGELAVIAKITKPEIKYFVELEVI